MEQTYYANPSLQPQRCDIPTELHLPWLVARPDKRPEDADGVYRPVLYLLSSSSLFLRTEKQPVDIYIRPLKLRVGWVPSTPGLQQQHMWRPLPHEWQPAIAGIGHIKATGVVMGPRFLKALVPDQTTASLMPTTPGQVGGSTGLRSITEQAQRAEGHELPGYTLQWDGPSFCALRS